MSRNRTNTGKRSQAQLPAGAGEYGRRRPLISFRWKEIETLFGESFEGWNRHNAPRLGAALAFYALFSLTPLLLVLVGMGSVVFGQKAAEHQLVWQFRSFVGPTGVAAIEALLKAASRHPAHGVLASILGFLMLLAGASAVFVELRDALNTIWEIPVAPVRGLTGVAYLIKARLFSFGLVLAIGFLLVVSLAVSAALDTLGRVYGLAPVPAAALQIINELISLVAIAALFAAIYKTLPEVRLRWRDVFLGAVTTSILFTIGKLAIGIYIGRASFTSTYGAAGSVVLFTFWIYYSSLVFFLGAEFTKAFATRYGSRPDMQPKT